MEKSLLFHCLVSLFLIRLRGIQFFINPLSEVILVERSMAGNELSIESVEVTLVSGIGVSSAALMKDAYLSHPGETTGQGPSACPVQSGDLYPEEEQAGPGARACLTKIVSRTPDAVIKQVLRKDPGHTLPSGNHDFYTVIFTLSVRPKDPSTTRLINGMIEFALPEDEEILDYSPRDKSSITALIENGKDTIFLSPGLVFLSPESADRRAHTDPAENRFGIPIGHKGKLAGTYTAKTGYSFAIPAGLLLEYEGLLKNQHEIFWEIYPPMPPRDNEICGEAMLAVFSLIIRTPADSPPEVRAIFECRLKGDLWGVIPLNGSVDIP